MLALYSIREDRLAASDQAATIENAAWIDLLNPTQDDEARVERALGIDIPTREEMAEIEESSRLYNENDILYMTASLLVGGHAPMPKTEPVTFILARDRLITVRYSEPSVFRTFVAQAGKPESSFKSAGSVFIALLEAIIDRTADILERVGLETDAVSTTVFQNDIEKNSVSRDYKGILRRLGRAGDLNSKVRESLVSIGRMVNFLRAECADLFPHLHDRTATMAADIRSLSDHATYVAGSSTFLLDALVGLITIDQNNIIKIVSVISVVIMPPTLIASIYGMNFRFMPELGSPFGYPVAIVAMIGAAILPYWYFKRRGWL
jgi:magnesium transporter